MRTRFLIFALFAFSALAPAQSSQAMPNRYFGPALTFKTKGSGDWPDERINPVALPDGRLLLSRFGTVYMLDATGKQLWKYETGSENESLTAEPAYNAATNEVGVVGYDQFFARLDATTGKERWRATTVGGASFINVASYGRGFLVVVDMTHYREESKMDHLRYRDPDQLQYWGHTEDDGWIADFPIGARLLVSGKQVYAVWRARGGVRLRALQPVQKPRR
jgi:PQQ-like domain